MAARLVVCLLLAFVLARHVSGESGVIISCPQGWNLHTTSNKCIKTFDGHVTWDDARRHCQGVGGDLINILDNSTHQFIQDLLGSHPLRYWIGLRAGNNDNKYVWTDGLHPTTFSNWRKGNTQLQNGRRCIEIWDSENRQWNAASCSKRNGFICELQTTAVTKTCPLKWKAYLEGNKCIYYDNYQKYWGEARTHCQNRGGDLLIVPDVETHEFIKKTIPTHYFRESWIGLSFSSFRYEWIDGTTPTRFSNWKDDFRTKRGCVKYTYRNFEWAIETCRRSNYLICEKAMDVVLKTTTCPREWTDYSDANKCFRTFHVKKSWKDARNFCQLQGGDLLTIPERLTNQFISNTHLSGSDHDHDFLWIGLSKLDKKDFTWVDNTTVAGFKNWSPGRPFTTDGDNKCVQLAGDINNKWFDYSCDEMVEFICERPATVISTRCPSQWDSYQVDNKCVKVFHDMKTWSDARDSCKRHGGDLVTVPDNSTNTFITKETQQSARKYYWIGLSYSDEENRFSWVDNTPLVSFNDWGQGQSEVKARESCVRFSTFKDSKWYHLGCLQKADFICQQMAIVQTVECPLGWDTFQGSNTCVRAFHEGKTWPDARAFCQGQGGDLVTIPDNTTNDFIYHVMEMSETTVPFYWMGLSYVDNLFKWIDNTQLDYEFWDYKQPSYRKNGACGAMYRPRGWWYDVMCESRSYGFICQKSATITTSRSFPTSIHVIPSATIIKTGSTQASSTSPGINTNPSQHVTKSVTKGVTNEVSKGVTKGVTNGVTKNVTSSANPKSVSSDGDSSLSGGSKAGIAIGCICIIALGTVFVIALLRRAGMCSWPRNSNGEVVHLSFVNKLWKVNSSQDDEAAPSSQA